MNFDLWLAFLVACIVLAISPGAGAVNSMSIAMKHGFKRSLISNLGLQVGNIINITIVGAGLGALLAQSEVMFFTIKWAGIIYLIYLGIQKFRESTTDCNELERRQDESAWKVFTQAVFINITNPKSIVFLVALLPQFIDPLGSYLQQMQILGITMVVVDLTVMAGYSMLATRVAHLIQSKRHLMIQNRIFGCMFIGAGTLLAAISRN
ncbi:Homoserine/homoserine lactone efflux protein [Moritella sp. JT01]|uniref:homoserine/homoserine lactone efflux protein n=1 Tax=Moritella sp. JT01 TaxID=756698 RepID=UPI0007977111|nr:homoserine/homoserine lactone efflux protein [Moritella sp. JT01]KXO14280.1 Homoserine/homoserine lactone efflux protein [Moritella sp. JT01]